MTSAALLWAVPCASSPGGGELLGDAGQPWLEGGGGGASPLGSLLEARAGRAVGSPRDTARSAGGEGGYLL